MANPLKSFFEKKSQSVLGVDIGSGSIKVVQMRKKKGKAILETYGELSLGPYAGLEIGRATRLDPEKLTEALNDVLKEANITTVDCAISIPMRSSMVAVVKMPKLKQSQMAQMVPIEARKYIPVPISEVTLDWFEIPRVEDEDAASIDPNQASKIPNTEVLVVAIHNDVLNNYSSIVNNSKLQASFFEIEMFSAIRTVINKGMNKPVLICDMGSGTTKLYIVERGIIRDSHIINRGSQDITLNISKSIQVDIAYAEKLKRNYGRNEANQDKQLTEIIDLFLSPIVSETNSFMLNFQRKYNKDISEAVFIGGGALLNNFLEKVNPRLNVPGRLGNPFEKLETPAFLQNVLSKTGLAFAPAIGLGLRKLQELE